ncbi:thioredoxin F-type, chloroplastic [Silene latifolia]|uniref:thioredoxin F-type, chloroplastic n=1 Tax=Silene latifolia TaxID=37657 RepID=UPI003D77000A
MALQISSLGHQTWCKPTHMTSPDPTRCLGQRVGFGWSNSKSGWSSSKMVSEKVRVKCASSLEVNNETDNLVGKVTEVNKDTFWPTVNSAQDKTLVLDMYTQWCGPCKVIAPKVEELAQKNHDVIFLKLDCNQENKALAKELGIRVVPTFKILRDGKVVQEVTGAKLENLVKAINDVRGS